MTRHIVITTATLALLAGPAFAIVTEIDLDGDGAYSLTEVQTVMPELTSDAFAVMDANGDGVLDADEVTAAVQAGLMPEAAN